MTVQLNFSGTFPSMIPLARTFLTKCQRLVHKDETWALVSGLPRDYHTVVRVQHLSLGRLVTVGSTFQRCRPLNSEPGAEYLENISLYWSSIWPVDDSGNDRCSVSTTVICNWWCLFLNVRSWRSSLALFDCSWFIFLLFILIPTPKLIILCQ